MTLLLALALWSQPGPRELAGAGRTEEAIEMLQASSDPRELVLLAELLVRADRIPEAEATLARVATGHPELEVTRASLLFRLSRYHDAGTVAEALLAEHPDHPFAHYYLGAVLLRTGDPAGAARHARRALPELAAEAPAGEIPPRAEALHLLGEAGLRLGDEAEAEAALREALALAPWHPGPAYLLGQQLLADGREAEGTRFLDRFARARKAAAAVDLGVQLLAREPAAAKAQFRNALEIFPGHPPATVWLARARQ